MMIFDIQFRANPAPSDVIPRLIVGEVVLVTVRKLTTFHGVASCIFESLDATGTTPPRPRLPPTPPLPPRPPTTTPPISTHREDQRSSDYNLTDNDTVPTEPSESQGSLDERTVPQSGGSGSCISLGSVESREAMASIDDEDGTATASDAHSAAHNANAIKIEEQASGRRKAKQPPDADIAKKKKKSHVFPSTPAAILATDATPQELTLTSTEYLDGDSTTQSTD
ncbi:hypothetical protein H257_00344 [Aphanomyces astaci]|uniref:Uncharacterized protein n=1 Tax=Aphanomyces astaci TaxID=112090 RepID=W4HC60_APHAT|nr:hypothetical protein H257_00344 [Aphanomyces astaci]ETV88879.1 hypothetical protein H257_00344 [Aphanomyces astaci]|eukprot:XP_009821279.1 hypothetical protein H257_00344 [Aphanomyces astaci]